MPPNMGSNLGGLGQVPPPLSPTCVICEMGKKSPSPQDCWEKWGRRPAGQRWRDGGERAVHTDGCRGQRPLCGGSKQLSSGAAVQAGGGPWFAASVHSGVKLVPGRQAKVTVREPDQGACRPALSPPPKPTCPGSPRYLALHMCTQTSSSC